MRPVIEYLKACNSLLLTGLLVLPLMGCASHSVLKIEEYFDENNLTAVIRANQSALFVSRQPALSSRGGDMLSVGPVYTVESTRHKQALWVGFWTTIDRHYIQQDNFPVTSEITIEFQDESITLHLEENFATGAAGNWQTYPPIAPGTRNLYYLITDQQILALVKQEIITIRVQSSDGRETIYHSDKELASILSAYAEYMMATEKDSVAVYGNSDISPATKKVSK